MSMYYWPEETGNAPYVSDLAEYLASVGYAVTVLAGMPHYPEWRVRARYRGRLRVAEQRAGVRVVRRWHVVPRRQTAIRRVAYEASFLASSGLFSPRPAPDAVIGIVPTLSDGLLARAIAARVHAAYGLIVQDLVAPAASQSGIAGGARVAALARRAERWMLARATVVAPVTNAFVDYLAGLGVGRDRIEVLPNWSRLAPPTGDRAETRRALGWRDEDFVALHAGNMGLKQGLEQVVEAARLVEERGAGVRFVLMGDGNQRSSLEALADGTPHLEFHPFVEARALPDVLAAADALLVSERPSVHDMSLPSKLTSYFAAGRPVIAAVDLAGSTAREIARAGAGRVVPAGAPVALLDALMELRADPESAMAWTESGQRYARTTLSREAILPQAAGLASRIVQQTLALRELHVS